MPQHIATWNPTTQLWETDQIDLFSGHSEPYSATFPTSGMTRSGRLFPLPMSGHRIGGSESSSLPQLPTPRRTDFQGKDSVGEWTRHSPSLDAVKFHFPALTGSDVNTPPPSVTETTSPQSSSKPTLMPTPRASDGTEGGPNQRGSSGDLMLPSAEMNLE